ncbi:MAG: hypothetical protein WCJ34_16030 [Alcaligenaceae bacterium]
MKKKQRPIVATLAKPIPLTKRTAKLLRDEGHAWNHVLRYEWIYLLMFAIAAVVFIFFWQPLPPQTLGIAVGREGTSDGMYGEKLVSFFAEHGVKLNLTYTEGGKQPILAMQREDSIQSALVLGGLHKKHEIDYVWSLGSSQYEPLWLFYRGDTYLGDEPIFHFVKTGLAIGQPNSGSNTIVRQILATRRDDVGGTVHLLEDAYLKSVDALLAGDINALATVDGIDSPIIKRLLADPNIKIANFPFAPAYVKYLPQLDLVSIPRGSFTISPTYPATDINMVATSLTLVVQNDLHPALQLLFLMAIDHLGDSRDQFFARPDEFPSYKDSNIPIAPLAKHYLANGAPHSVQYFPFWAASLFDRVWFFILGSLAVLYPLYRLIPNYRKTLSQLKVNDAFDMLHAIQLRFAQAQSQEEFDLIMEDFLQLQRGIEEWIPRLSIPAYYSLLRPIENIKKVAIERQNFLISTLPQSSG